jgi:hypothetical protein
MYRYGFKFNLNYIFLDVEVFALFCIHLLSPPPPPLPEPQKHFPAVPDKCEGSFGSESEWHHFSLWSRSRIKL